MFRFVKVPRSFSRRNPPAPRPLAAHWAPAFEQLGEALFTPGSPTRRPGWKPTVEALEERQLMSITGAVISVTGTQPGTFAAGSINTKTTTVISATTSRLGNFALNPVNPQQLSNMTSTTDYFGNMFFFEIASDHYVYYCTSARPGTWYATGGAALSISAGWDAAGHAAVYLIGYDHAVYQFDTYYSQWTDLGGYALSISATQGPTDAAPLVYAVGGDSNLYVYNTNGGTGWTPLGSPAGTSTNGGLVTISAVNCAMSGSLFTTGPESVCYATDIYGDVCECNVDYQSLSPYSGYWRTLGYNAVQVAAGYSSFGDPIVYVLGTDHTVSVNYANIQTTWANLGGNALEISAGRSWGYHNQDPSAEIVYAIGSNHSVMVTNWSGSTLGSWQNLGGYATAISAEAVVGTYGIDGVFANDAHNDACEYAGYWATLQGKPMLASQTPLLF